ncbi:type II toxin-antitoxin system RnlB family antitoxin [Sebaldella termitidis]|uniref:type II toxin-antitoxin system RnlB family antitoxin n=1 Tax=Sebaldella termitidis TaxID=826 RepID=UPI003EB98999
MKNYKILFLKSHCLILSKSYINPFNEIEKIEKELRNKNYQGLIYMDQLISNGLANNRFIQCEFSNGFILRNTCRVLENTSNEIKKTSQSYYLKNEQFIENSVLNNTQKFLYKHGKIT